MTPFFCRVATYNIHGCRGRDRRFDVERIVEVIAELDADVIALQEVESRRACSPVDQFAAFEAACGMHGMRGEVIESACGGAYGNMILSRFPARCVRRLDLAQPEREPRGALEARIEPEGWSAFQVVATHLGLLAAERNAQFQALTESAMASDVPLVLAGDLNEWMPLRTHLRDWRRRYSTGRGRRSFPSGTPLFALDRIFGQGGATVRRQWAHRSRLARVASDHRPVIAELEIPLDTVPEPSSALVAELT